MMAVHIYWALGIHVKYSQGLLGIDLLLWKTEHPAMEQSDFLIFLNPCLKKNLVMTVCAYNLSIRESETRALLYHA